MNKHLDFKEKWKGVQKLKRNVDVCNKRKIMAQNQGGGGGLVAGPVYIYEKKTFNIENKEACDPFMLNNY